MTIYIKRFIFLFLYVLVVTGSVSAQTNDREKIDLLLDAAFNVSQIEYGDYADSLNEEAIRIAEMSLNKDLEYVAIMGYLLRDKYGNPGTINPYCFKKAKELELKLNDSQKKFHLWIALANRLANRSQAREANNYSRQALAFAAASEDLSIKIKAYLASARTVLNLEAKDNDIQNQIKEARQNLLMAENHASKLDEGEFRQAEIQILKERYKFRNKINDFDKAKEIKQELIKIIESQKDIDSLDLMWSYYDLSVAVSLGNADIRIDDKIRSILSYCRRTNNNCLARYARSRHASHLIDNLNIKEFQKNYANHFRSKALTDTSSLYRANYCLTLALNCEDQNNPDSAIILFEQAIKHLESQSNKMRVANYRRRYGQFLLRHGNKKEAYTQLQIAMQIAVEENYDEYILEISPILDSLASKFGDFQKAHEYASLHLNALKQKSPIQLRESLTLMALENQEKQNEIKLAEQEIEEKRKHNIQYFAIGVGLILLFLIMIIVSSMKVPNWLIQMLAFFSILFIFEFVILILDHKIHNWAHGEPIKIFLVKIAILSVLFPLHHVIEGGVTNYMVRHQLIKRPKRSAIRKFFERLYPWLRADDEPDSDHG